MLGSMTTSVVVPLVAVTVFDAGPGWMGLLTAAAWLPWLLIGLPAGAWVDRSDARRVMIAADLGAAAAIGSVPLAWALDLLTLPHLVLAALGVGGARGVPPRRLPPARAPRRRRATTSRRRTPGSSAPSRRCRSLGPGVGGLLVAARLRRLGGRGRRRVVPRVGAVPAPHGPPHPGAPASGAHAARAAAARGRDRHPGGVPRPRSCASSPCRAASSNFALTGYYTLLVLFLVRDLDLDPGRVGAVLAAGSVGGLVGAGIATPGRGPARGRPRHGGAAGRGRPARTAHRAGAARPAGGARAARPGPRRRRRRGRERAARHLPDALHPTRAARPHHVDVVPASTSAPCRWPASPPAGSGTHSGCARPSP